MLPATARLTLAMAAGAAIITASPPIIMATPASAGSYASVYSFKGGSDGAAPLAGLLNVGGTLYGTTVFGGTGNCGNPCGTVFSLNPSSGVETVVHSFVGSDGYQPSAALIKVGSRLYGTTGFGGTGCGGSGCGTVFALNPANGAVKVVHSFVAGSDGANPFASLTKVGGTLYGTTQYGGDTNNGTVFSVNPSTHAETVVYSFQGGSDGSQSIADLIRYNGLLYGTTLFGGTKDNGTVFAVDPATGAESVVYSLQGGRDGAHLYAGVINVRGTLFGATRSGGGTGCGGNGCGVVFALDPATGTETIMHSFAGPDGATPLASLVYAGGSLYGTTISGGLSETSSTHGTIYAIDAKTGAETALHFFGNGSDGGGPRTTLIDVGGTLYGTTCCRGAAHYGTVFSYRP